MYLTNSCVVLHMCASFHDYRTSLSFWANQSRLTGLRTYGIDGCSNISFPLEIGHIPYVQKSKPTHSRFKISSLERMQMQTVAKTLPHSCKFVVKLTGKYMIRGLSTQIASLRFDTALALSSRKFSYGGVSSEIFGISRTLLTDALALWTDDRNTESFVYRLYRMMSTLAPQQVFWMSRMPTTGTSIRFTDKKKLSYL